MAHALPPLPYDYNALEPHIDEQTMRIHHDKHHAAYVNNLNAALEGLDDLLALSVEELIGDLNKALEGHADLQSKSIEALLQSLDSLPESIRTAVRNNGGGHANHTMFWQIMGPNGGAPDGDVAGAIQRDFGGLPALQDRFNDAGAKQFGSGWVFVTVDGTGKLAIESKPNQDTPLMDGKHALLGNDVWEHAYYLKYENRRPDYLKAWWNAVNWKAIGQRYAAAKAGTLQI